MLYGESNGFNFCGILKFIWNKLLTVYHFRGHDSLSLAVFSGILLWGATDQTGTGYRVPLAFESDIRSASFLIDSSMENYYNGCFHESIQDW